MKREVTRTKSIVCRSLRLLLSGFLGVIIAAWHQKLFAADTGMPGVSATSTLQGEQKAGDQALSFDSDFLNMESGRNKHIDLSYFAHKGGMQPGHYPVQVRVNGKLVDDGRLVNFRSWPDQPGKLYACVSAQHLAEWWGVIASRKGDAESDKGRAGSRDDDKKSDVTPEGEEGRAATGVPVSSDDSSDTCAVGGVVAMVPYAQEEFDFNKRLLSLTVPQAYLGPASRMRTPPQIWDEGMPAILMNYNYSGSQQQNNGKATGSDFLGLNGQVNLLGWRVRDDMTWHKSQGEAAEISASNVYAQRDYAAMGGGQLTVGRTSSSGGGVDSVQFTGLKVDSDDSMLDPKFTTYSPAITGIANSPATVTVRQYGKVIYQQNVPQGPFSLTDFNRSGNGDVDVEIRESDGSTRHFTMSQAQSGSLLRLGALTYSASAGKATDSTGYADDRFVQAGVSYGAWANTTLSGGALLSQDYQALSVGTGLYAGAWGAVGYTLTGSRANLSVVPGQGGAETGLSHSVNWSRSFGDTSVGVAWTHNQSKEYHSYSELLSMKPATESDDGDTSGNTRDTYSLSLSQSLGVWGSVSLNGTRSTTWDSNEVQNNFSLSYNTTVKDIGIAVSLGYSTYNGSDSRYDDDNSVSDTASDNGSRTDKSVAVNISLPLGKWLNANSVSGTYSYTRTNGQVSQQAGASGSAMNGALSWSVSQGMTGTKTGNTSIGYSGRYGVLTGGYSYGGGNKSVSYGANGGFAVHQHGVTLGKQLALGGGNALVEIPGAEGVNVGNAVTDWRGYALVSGLTPYDLNRVTVDMTNLPGDVELDASSKNVVPTRGALVAVPFRSNKGYRLMINLVREKEEVPFGSMVSLLQSDESALPVTGIVGDAGQVYMSGMPGKGKISASWGEGAGNQCSAVYALPDNTDEGKVVSLQAPCH